MPDFNKMKEEVKTEMDKIPPTSDRNLMAALSYVWLLSIVMLVLRHRDAFIKFHAKQGVILVVLTIFWWIPVVGWLLWILAVAGMVFGFVNAWQGKEHRLPFVANWADRLLKF